MQDQRFRAESFSLALKSEIIDLAAKVVRTVRAGVRGERRFRGAFGSYEEAMAAVRPGALKGYNHEVLTGVCYETMSQVALQDYPVMFWLRQILADGGCILDAGGHMGTKYRAFQPYLKVNPKLDWWVYDLPAFVRAGSELAHREGLTTLHFIDDLKRAPAADVLLGSGLLLYLDLALPALISQLKAKPPHLLLNKVATRAGPTVVTLENFGVAEVPYQIRNGAEIAAALEDLGYQIRDEWTIPHLAHTLPGHPELGHSTSRRYYAVLRPAGADHRGGGKQSAVD